MTNIETQTVPECGKMKYKIKIVSEAQEPDAALAAIEAILDELEELAASVKDRKIQMDETIISHSASDVVEFDSAMVYFSVKAERWKETGKDQPK